MKKVCCMIALAAISFSSVYAANNTVKSNTIQQDSTKKKMKMKDGKRKMKAKTDSTKTKTKMKMPMDSTKKM